MKIEGLRKNFNGCDTHAANNEIIEYERQKSLGLKDKTLYFLLSELQERRRQDELDCDECNNCGVKCTECKRNTYWGDHFEPIPSEGEVHE